MKKVLIILTLFLCVACGNNNAQKDKMSDFILKSTSNQIVNKLDELANKIQMFPEEKIENEFIYLIEGIKDNIDKFSTSELETIKDKLNFNYSFSFNSINYSKEQFYQVIDFIKEKMNK